MTDQCISPQTMAMPSDEDDDTAVAPSDEDDDAAVVLRLPVADRALTNPVDLDAGPDLQVDEEYLAFLSFAAGQVAAAVADVQAVQRELGSPKEWADLERSQAQYFAAVAAALQRALLEPTVLPRTVAVHYEPASTTSEVGGDWYDVVPLPDGRLGVVVGDVVGRGLAATAVMGQLLIAGRSLLLEGYSPGQVLSAMDRFAALVPGAAVSTVFCAVIDPSAGTLRYSSAGHLPAIVADADGAVRLLEDAGSVPLGVVDGLHRPEADAVLSPASAVLLYTDGLVQRRHQGFDEGIARAAAVLREGRHLPLAELATLLTDRLMADPPDDDVAFLLYRMDPPRPVTARSGSRGRAR